MITPRSHSEDRGQPEALDEVLLVSVIIIGITVIGTAVVADYSEQGDQTVLDATINVTSKNVSVTHTGGDVFQNSNLDVVVYNDSIRIRRSFDNDTARSDGGDTDATFTPGEEAVFGHSQTGELTVLIIDTKTNVILERKEESLS